MLRNALLFLSNQQGIFDFVRHNGIAKSFASRFVAGESVKTALDAVRSLNAKGITASLDLLGESTTNEKEAYTSQREYLELLDLIEREKLNANVSLKLTAMGMDISDDLCVRVTREILERAKKYGNFVRLDMESSAYTQKTIDMFEKHFYADFKANVGIVLQSYLYRTEADAKHASAIGARVRICKGAYKEPAEVAFPEKSDVDKSYVKAMHHLMEHGNYPGIATHDEVIIAEAKRFAKEKGIANDRFEFQMLYGVRRDLQESLVRDGYRIRCYVPFGTQWYPYLMRRLAERPANMAFMAGNVVREWVGGRQKA
jgi:proline dehydrogenase